MGSAGGTTAAAGELAMVVAALCVFTRGQVVSGSSRGVRVYNVTGSLLEKLDDATAGVLVCLTQQNSV